MVACGDYFLDFANTADRDPDSDERELWLDRLNAEFENLWAALDCCVANRDFARTAAGSSPVALQGHVEESLRGRQGATRGG